MGFSVRTLSKNIIGLLLLPVTAVCIASCISLLITIEWHRYPTYLFIIGFIVYLALYPLNKTKSFSYVLGHELLHAVTSVLLGGKLLSIFVSHKSGSVNTTKDNFIISLVPYCIPFYAMVLSIIYYGLSILVYTRRLIPWFIFLLGITLSHHYVLTIRYIIMGQKDIASHGKIFSYSVILISNIIVLTFLLGLFLHHVPFVSFWQKTIETLTALV